MLPKHAILPCGFRKVSGPRLHKPQCQQQWEIIYTNCCESYSEEDKHMACTEQWIAYQLEKQDHIPKNIPKEKNNNNKKQKVDNQQLTFKRKKIHYETELTCV